MPQKLVQHSLGFSRESRMDSIMRSSKAIMFNTRTKNKHESNLLEFEKKKIHENEHLALIHTNRDINNERDCLSKMLALKKVYLRHSFEKYDPVLHPQKRNRYCHLDARDLMKMWFKGKSVKTEKTESETQSQAGSRPVSSVFHRMRLASGRSSRHMGSISGEGGAWATLLTETIHEEPKDDADSLIDGNEDDKEAIVYRLDDNKTHLMPNKTDNTENSNNTETHPSKSMNSSAQPEEKNDLDGQKKNNNPTITDTNTNKTTEEISQASIEPVEIVKSQKEDTYVIDTYHKEPTLETNVQENGQKIKTNNNLKIEPKNSQTMGQKNDQKIEQETTQKNDLDNNQRILPENSKNKLVKSEDPPQSANRKSIHQYTATSTNYTSNKTKEEIIVNKKLAKPEDRESEYSRTALKTPVKAKLPTDTSIKSVQILEKRKQTSAKSNKSQKSSRTQNNNGAVENYVKDRHLVSRERSSIISKPSSLVKDSHSVSSRENTSHTPFRKESMSLKKVNKKIVPTTPPSTLKKSNSDLDSTSLINQMPNETRRSSSASTLRVDRTLVQNAATNNPTNWKGLIHKLRGQYTEAIIDDRVVEAKSTRRLKRREKTFVLSRARTIFPGECKSTFEMRRFFEREVSELIFSLSPKGRRQSQIELLKERERLPTLIDQSKSTSAILKDFRKYRIDTRTVTAP